MYFCGGDQMIFWSVILPFAQFIVTIITGKTRWGTDTKCNVSQTSSASSNAHSNASFDVYQIFRSQNWNIFQVLVASVRSTFAVTTSQDRWATMQLWPSKSKKEHSRLISCALTKFDEYCFQASFRWDELLHQGCDAGCHHWIHAGRYRLLRLFGWKYG